MARWTKGNSGYAGKGKGQGKSTLPTDVPARYDEGFLDEMDGRSEVSRALRQRLGALVSDLGGVGGLSYQEQSLARRCVHLERQVERFETTLAHGGSVDVNNYLHAIITLSSLFAKIGLKRRARQISLTDYLHDKTTTDSVPKP